MYSGRASEFKPIPLSTSVRPQTRSQQQQAVSQSTDPRSRTTTTDKKGNGGLKRAIGRVESPTLEQQFATHAAEKEPVAAALLPDLKRARLTWSSTGAIPDLTGPHPEFWKRHQNPHRQFRPLENSFPSPHAFFSTSSRSKSGNDAAPTAQHPTILRLEAEKHELSHLLGESKNQATKQEEKDREIIRKLEVSRDAFRQELFVKEDRVRTLEKEARKSKIRIRELEEELRKRKAESERGAKKKFRFSIEVEVDGERIEGAVADAEG